MANSLTVFDQTFSSQKEAEFFFYQIRDASFLARYIGREGGTTVGFGVTFDNGKETEFSARKAIKAVAAGVTR